MIIKIYYVSDTLQGPYILTKVIQRVIQSWYLNHNSARGEICSLKQWIPFSAKSTLADLQVIDITVPTESLRLELLKGKLGVAEIVLCFLYSLKK